MKDGAAPYSIGHDKWNGLSKLIEECGEVLQTAGKLLAVGGADEHWNVPSLRAKLEEEIADLEAAICFFIDTNGLSTAFRRQQKYNIFQKWNSEAKQ